MTTPTAAAVRSRYGDPRPRIVRGMGERASYVVVEPAGWRLHRSKWGASQVLADVVAGPACALRRIGDRPETASEEWLDPTWCGGGVLVDEQRRVLLFYGAHRQVLALDVRAALFQLLRHTWPGWTVRWAYGGAADLRSYVGANLDVDLRAHVGAASLAAERRAQVGAANLGADPRAHVGAANRAGAATAMRSGAGAIPPPPGGAYQAPWWTDAIGTLVSVRHAAGDVLIHPLDLDLDPLWEGPSLIGRMPPGVRQLTATRWPACGAHLDLGRRAVTLWTASTLPGWDSIEFGALWSGWEVHFRADELNTQLAACAGALSTPPISVAAGADRLATLLRDAWSTEPDGWAGTATRPGPIEGVSAQARAEYPALPSAAERHAVFDALRALSGSPCPAGPRVDEQFRARD